jgi:hypothetical protein
MANRYRNTPQRIGLVSTVEDHIDCMAPEDYQVAQQTDNFYGLPYITWVVDPDNTAIAQYVHVDRVDEARELLRRAKKKLGQYVISEWEGVRLLEEIENYLDEE